MCTLKTIRHKKMIMQGGRCYYCNLPMWDDGAVAEFSDRNVALRCTAEHLQARCDGGKNRQDNIVAACLYCNTHRHRRKRVLTPSAYREHVRRRMLAGKWLAAHLSLAARCEAGH